MVGLTSLISDDYMLLGLFMGMPWIVVLEPVFDDSYWYISVSLFLNIVISYGVFSLVRLFLARFSNFGLKAAFGVYVGMFVPTLLGVSLWMLPAFMQPDWVYDLKYGDQYPAKTEVGDGVRMIDYGPRMANGRMKVELGNMAEPGVKTFELHDLPEITWYLVLECAQPKRAKFGFVLIEVKDDLGKVLLKEEWMESYVKYNKRDRRFRKKRYNFGPIETHPERTYSVKVTTRWTRDVPRKPALKLKLAGGGWK